MKRRAPLILGLFALLACRPGAFVAMISAQETDTVAVVLLPEAVVDDSLFTLDQIAKVSGGRDSIRRRLEKLDIAEFKLGASHMTVLSEQVRFRLLLAGLDETQFRLSGAKRTNIVESDEPATLRKILAAAEQVLREHYSSNPAQMSLTPNRGINVPGLELRKGERVRFEAKVKGPLPRAGTARLEVALVVGGKVREVVPVSFEIAEHELAQATASKSKSGVRPALYTAPASDGPDFLIKTSDNVKIIAYIGTTQVEALGEAMQDGRMGDMIRVRNVESNRIVHGRVEAGGLVQVDY